MELGLTAAEKKDPQGLGLHFHKNGEPEEDAAGLQAYQERCLLSSIVASCLKRRAYTTRPAHLACSLEGPIHLQLKKN